MYDHKSRLRLYMLQLQEDKAKAYRKKLLNGRVRYWRGQLLKYPDIKLETMLRLQRKDKEIYNILKNDIKVSNDIKLYNRILEFEFPDSD